MERVSLDDVEPQPLGDGTRRLGLSEPLDTTHVAVNHYRVPPGEGLPAGLHAHMDQEEVFVVLAGTATFETLHGEVRVDAGEAIRFPPGEFQSGMNEADEELVLLGFGAPRVTEDIRIPVQCPSCAFESLRVEMGDDAVRLSCPDCDAVHVSSPCPDCGHDDLRVTLGNDGRTVVECHGCGSIHDEPPLED